MLIKVPFFGDRGAGSSIFGDREAGRHRETETYVPSGQPHPVPRVIEGSGSALDIRKVFVSPHCPLEGIGRGTSLPNGR